MGCLRSEILRFVIELERTVGWREGLPTIFCTGSFVIDNIASNRGSSGAFEQMKLESRVKFKGVNRRVNSGAVVDIFRVIGKSISPGNLIGM